MITVPPALEAAIRLRGASIWIASLCGLAVAVVLSSVPQPAALVRLTGGPMAWMHGVVVFAVVTLVGQTVLIARWDEALCAWLNYAYQPAEDRFCYDDRGWESLRVAVDDTIHRLERSWRETRLMIAFVPYLAPLLGFGVSVWDPGTDVAWRVVARPLLIAILEAFFVLLLAIGVSGAFQVVADGWNSVLKLVQRPEPVR